MKRYVINGNNGDIIDSFQDEEFADILKMYREKGTYTEFVRENGNLILYT